MRLPSVACLALLVACADASFSPPAPLSKPQPGSDQPPMRSVAALDSSATLADLSAVNATFRAWLRDYQNGNAATKAALLEQGASLATTRRTLMRQLLLENPERAIVLAFTPPERAAMPGLIRERVERWHDGMGMLHVIASTVANPAVNPPVARYVTFNDAETTFLRAGLFGRRLAQKTQTQLRLHGVELDGVIALTESPLRRRFVNERFTLPTEPPSLCPTSRNQVDKALVYHAGDTAMAFCLPAHAEQAEHRLVEQETVAGMANASWSLGPKTILVIRVDFSDRPGDPVSESGMLGVIGQTNTFFEAASFGQTSITATVTPTYRMPKTAMQYGDADDTSGLRTAALAAARANGFEPNDYSLDIVASTGIFGGFAGAAYVGTRGCWINGNYSFRVVAHEIGHNYGVYHANFWSAGTGIISPSGSNVEYGNPFDVMGGGGDQGSHFNIWFKRLYDWVHSNEVQVVSTSGTYRIFALETVITSGLHGLKVPRVGDPLTRDYWLEFRQARPGDLTLSNGALITFGYQFSGSQGSHLLDMTPENSKSQSALVIGRTFSDRLAGIHFTPVGKGGTVPESLDVVVNLGTFPGNQAPTASIMASATTVANNTSVTFTVTATDPDGDVLAYSWDFDDGSFGTNTATMVKTLSGDRVFNVRCTVSDMKGHLAVVAIPITVGTPPAFTLSGTVTENGVGLEGVRITDGTASTFSLSDGTWRLTNVPSGTASLSAAKYGYSVAASFTSPVTVSGATTGLDFLATASAGYSITGSVYGSVAISGVLVSDGFRSATTDGSGNYALTPVPDGRYSLTATKLGWRFNPKPLVEVFGTSVSAPFYATGQYLNGTIPADDVPTAPVVTDGIRSVTCTLSRGGGVGGNGDAPDAGTSWTYFIGPIPNGTWSLNATSPGVTLVPQNFTNPLTLTGSETSPSANFAVVVGASSQISGSVASGGTPMPGVVVSDGTRSATTNEAGQFLITGVPNGTYTLTPTHAGATFVPLTRSVTVSSGPVTGQDFATTVVNAPPTVVTPAAASPATVTGTTTTLTVLGADDGPESSLTYTWSSLGGRPVTLSANGTNGAKSTTVTFIGSGSYVFEVTIRDPGGLPVRSSVTVQVSQVATQLMLDPTTGNVVTGATQAFKAIMKDQFDGAMFAGTVAWSVPVAAGTVSTSGLFTAGSTVGGPHTLTAIALGKTGTASIRVVASGSPTLVTPASANPSPVGGKTTELSVLAADDAGEAGLTYTWSTVTSGVTFSVNGTNAAKVTTATFSSIGEIDFTVTIADAASNVIASMVHVSVVATPTSVEVQPQSAQVLASGTQSFLGTVKDQFDHSIVPQPAVTYAVSGGGTIGPTGLFTAGSTVGGPFTVTATSGTASGTASLTVAMAPDTVAPTVAVSAPTAGSRLIGTATFAATASDNVGVAKVELFLDGVSLGEDVMPPFTLMADVSTFSNGPHVVTAKATDAAGNSTVSDGVNVTVGPEMVDMTAPVVSIVTPTAGATVDLSVPVSVTATDDVGVVSVELELDGTVVRALTASPWAATLDVSVGAHSLVAIASDASGKSTRSASVAFVAQTGVMPADGGGGLDAGGQPDGGGMVSSDGGAATAADGGVLTEPEGVTTHCGCTSASGVPWLFGLLLVLRRRSTRSG